MLIRVQGGSGGIADYLEKGIKNGRDHTRDELDQRVILDGDLAITDQIITDMQTKTPDAERYLHVTLSFKEDNITREQLEEVVQDFKSFTMAAYEDDEYNFYAEAHLPKIKTLTDKKTGEQVERKPHIHVVIPETNLLTNKRLDPFGKVDHHKEYIDAFQEVSNEKYGFASPKVHIRQDFTDESTLISRVKGDMFKGANHATKKQILTDVLDKNITSTDQLASHLEEAGWSVKVRNEGKDNAYLNIKQPEAKRGINLKDTVFQPTFLALPSDDKHKALSPEQVSYTTPGKGTYKAPKEAQNTLNYWHERRAHEVRLVSRRDRERYNALPEPEKEEFLNTKRDKIYGQHRTPEPAEQSSDHLEAAGNYLLNAQRNSGSIEPGVRNIAHRRAIRAVSAAIQRHSGHQAKPEQLRERSVDSDALSQHQNDVVETDNSTTDKPNMAAIQKRMDAKALLVSLSQSHGVIPDKYPIIKGKDGSDRITCGNHNLNVADFLTKELHLPWQEAKEVLVKEDKRQQRQEIGPAIEQDREVFEYQWQPELVKERKKAWGQQLHQERLRRRANYQQLKTEKNAIYGDNTLDRKEKAVAASVARMNKVINDMQLSQLSQQEREAIGESYPKTFTQQWQQFEGKDIQTESIIMDKSSIKGELIDHGHAPYNNIKGNKESYYVTLNQNGSEKTVWGLDLEKAVSDPSLKKGDHVALTMNGKKAVEVNIEKKDKDGNVVSVDKVTTNRNEWQAEKIKAPEKEVEQPKEVSIDNINKHLDASRLMIAYPQLKEQGFSLQNIEKTDEGQKIKEGDKTLTITDYLETKGVGNQDKILKDLSKPYESQLKDRERVKAYKEKQKDIAINVGKGSSIDYGGEEKKQFQPLKPIEFDDVSYKSNDKGHVDYYVDKVNIVTDEGKRVTVNQTSDKGVEIGLRLSMEKFGDKLDVKGTEAYKKQIIDVAAREKLNISFTDSEMNQQLQKRRIQMEKGENIIQAAESRIIDQQRDVQPEQARQPTQEQGPDMGR